MRPVKAVRVAGAAVDIAVPSARRLAGVRMAGFRGTAESPVELQVVPHPALTVCIDLRGDVVLVDHASGERKRGSVVLGMAAASVRGSGRDVDLLQIRLSPGVVQAVLGVGAELGASMVDLADLWGREAERIREQLHSTGSWDDRFAIVTATLARRLEGSPAVDPEVAFAWGQLARSQGRARVEPLAAEVGWSRKRLWSRFRAQFGLTPKRAARLIRFDHVAHRLAAGHSAALVAAESGFADQSHLCRDVMAVAGMTPTAVATAPWLAVDDVAWPRNNSPRPPAMARRCWRP